MQTYGKTSVPEAGENSFDMLCSGEVKVSSRLAGPCHTWVVHSQGAWWVVASRALQQHRLPWPELKTAKSRLANRAAGQRGHKTV